MVLPSYNLLLNGMYSRISMVDSGIVFYEKSVTPPGLEASGEAIDVTTDRDVGHVNSHGSSNMKFNFSSFAPRYMKKNTQASATVAYDPVYYLHIATQVNKNQTILITFPDGLAGQASTSLQFLGWLKSFTPGPITIDEQPEAEVTFIVSNWKIPTSSHEDISSLIDPLTTF